MGQLFSLYSVNYVIFSNMRLLLIHIFLLLSIVIHGQNLVRNPGFEQNNYHCRKDTAPIIRNWNQCCLYWRDPSNVGSTVNGSCYFTPCTYWSGSFSPPHVFFNDYQQPKEGRSFTFINNFPFPKDTNGSGYRNYVQGQLIVPLIKSKFYYGWFYICAYYYSGSNRSVDVSRAAISALGMYLSPDSVVPRFRFNGQHYWHASPQIQNPSNRFITDTMNWTRIDGVFRAQGGEQYIGIGNFLPFSQTKHVKLYGDTGSLLYTCPYYLDDVGVIAVPEPKIGFKDTILCPGVKLLLHAHLPNTHTHWQDGSKGDSFLITKPGIYWVETDSFGSITRDSVNIGYNTGDSIKANYDIDKPVVCIGQKVNLINKSTNAEYITWYTDNKKIDSTQNITITYSAPGWHSIKMQISNKQGCILTENYPRAVFVCDTFSASFSISDTLTCAPANITFVATAEQKDYPFTYTWDFNDGTKGNGQIIIHQFGDIGNKDKRIRLLVSNGYCADTVSRLIHFIGLDKKTDFPTLRLATVSDNNDCIKLLWNKLKLAKTYTVLRSVNKIDFGAIGKTDDTFYMDHDTKVSETSYWYKIIAEDTCGNTSGYSNIARSILLKGNVAGNDSFASLIWNNYEGYPIKQYDLLRDAASPAYYSGNQLQYTDAYFYYEGFNSHTYRVYALENALNGLVSQSNSITFYYHPYVWTPNVFSPQKDGVNDTYKIVTSGINSLHLRILNRWGELIYESNGKDAGWDGYWKGMEAPEGVYMFQIYAQAANGSWLTKSGTIHLIR